VRLLYGVTPGGQEVAVPVKLMLAALIIVIVVIIVVRRD
jgi:hypothetical protein